MSIAVRRNVAPCVVALVSLVWSRSHTRGPTTRARSTCSSPVRQCPPMRTTGTHRHTPPRPRRHRHRPPPGPVSPRGGLAAGSAGVLRGFRRGDFKWRLSPRAAELLARSHHAEATRRVVVSRRSAQEKPQAGSDLTMNEGNSCSRDRARSTLIREKTRWRGPPVFFLAIRSCTLHQHGEVRELPW